MLQIRNIPQVQPREQAWGDTLDVVEQPFSPDMLGPSVLCKVILHLTYLCKVYVYFPYTSSRLPLSIMVYRGSSGQRSFIWWLPELTELIEKRT